ncbi:TPA: DUF551 domain-containing protein [Escherichia coli]|uniref:DUF551 domain-containing protein n=36 Tax=Enterobacteriaceae TaxID=543 RepID=A0A9Q6ZTE8_ECO57|nr:DUF551 domain-containing protein [Escherichia coli]NP_309545.1 putative phage protein [Escherichia coli O157:H7 str. Sakai]EEV1193607.1 DUF551 domain-containing protein [Escherichia coli O157:NM]EFW7046329.1 DUF551 domain-containing protein [Shigella sonnei]EHU63917.1 hypothetical protein ECDEC3B_1498 [Escherichia coli DEC3B]EHU74447.1 hypothetical protein ECDEC3C_1943 [Escherichia coli DEC3C]EHU79913.1 hypothetical protein ECDEC3D_1573 [Escherichia coli DEC3D]EHU81777.1 hypothetical prot
MTTITKDRLLTIQHWRETYGPGSNVVLPAEEAEELARIALASLAAVSDERAAYELFMEKRFGESVDRRRAKNGDRDYMVWDMALGWIIWCHRAAMLQAGNFRENKGSSTNNFREISETSTNYPVTPDGWISCSERMPDDGQHVIILCDGAFVLYAQYRDGEFFDVVRNGDEFFETQSRNVTDWMPLPEPPQEVRQ